MDPILEICTEQNDIFAAPYDGERKNPHLIRWPAGEDLFYDIFFCISHDLLSLDIKDLLVCFSQSSTLVFKLSYHFID